MTETETGDAFQLSTVPNEPVIVLSPLHPAYTYRCRVSALTVASGPFSMPITITTHEASEPHYLCDSKAAAIV